MRRAAAIDSEETGSAQPGLLNLSVLPHAVPTREFFSRPPRLGDVVLLKARNTFIVHRIIAKISRGQSYITKGDNCATADVPVACRDILGLVIGISNGGTIQNPWHWTWPFSIYAALLSRFDNRRGPQAVYPDPALRIMADLDILVKETDLSTAASILQQIGYSPWDKTVEDPADHHLPPFVKNGTVPVEIHRGLHRVGAPDIAGLWERAVQAKLGSGQAMVLSVEDLLLQLSLHASQHNFTLRLSSVYDVYETIRVHRAQIDWKELGGRAHRRGAGKALFLMLLLSVDLLGAAVPIEFLERIKPSDLTQDFPEYAKTQMLADTRAVSPRMAEMYRTRKLCDKIRILFEILFCPSKRADADRLISQDSRLLYPFRRLKFLLHTEYERSLRQMYHTEKEDLILVDSVTARTLQNWLAKP